MDRIGLRHSKRLSLSRALFADALKSAPDLAAQDPLAALAIARMDFLRSHEKLLVSLEAASREELLSLKTGDVQALIFRALKAQDWNPGLYWEMALRDADYFAGRNIRFVTVAEAEYPPQLREVYSPPFGLYLRGCLPDPERPAVGLVGTRVPTGRGLKAAFGLAAELSEAGVCVVSGLARGIDAAAHRGALRGRGKTLAVLPGGIDAVYPASNRGLAAALLDAGGALVTEYPPDSRIQRYCFPERNRIIAGLSRACVIVEAPEGSGALITADHALSEGRDVFVDGFCLESSRNQGGRALAAQGAAVVRTAKDIFAEWAAKGNCAESGGAESNCAGNGGAEKRRRRKTAAAL